MLSSDIAELNQAVEAIETRWTVGMSSKMALSPLDQLIEESKNPQVAAVIGQSVLGIAEITCYGRFGDAMDILRRLNERMDGIVGDLAMAINNEEKVSAECQVTLTRLRLLAMTQYFSRLFNERREEVLRALTSGNYGG